MSLFRRAAKRDQSERLIVETLKQLGWSVLQVSVKDGPDLFASKTGRWMLRDGVREQCAVVAYPRTVAIEVKSGTKKLRPGQEAFRANWQGEYVILRSVEDALALTGGQE